MCEGCEERIHVGHQVHRIDRSISKLLEMRVKEEGLDEIALMHGWILRYLYEHQDKEIYQKDIEKWYLPFSGNKYYPDSGEKRVHLPCIGCK